ncbi:MAG: four-carbon acid sugar kinase family protein [Granulosicoccus sp.]
MSVNHFTVPESQQNSLQDGVLVAWYGDDFTGAAAVMEVLEFAGLPSMLFLDVPTQVQLERYPNLRCIGVASTARTQSPSWMDEQLPRVYEQLKQLNPALVHYKVCSTLDSSPHTGSIGRAIEIASNHFSSSVVPVLVAAPQMRRYQCFGHLFAGVGDEVIRLDRHPVMAHHPVTPMDESDVARHIAKQSERLDVDFLSLEALTAGIESLNLKEYSLDDQLSVVTLDCMDTSTESAVGRLIWQGRSQNHFVVGSQGVEYALVQYWQDSEQLQAVKPPGSIGPSTGMVAVSGSVSPTTAEQISWSCRNGFSGITLDAVKVCTGEKEAEIERVVNQSLAALEAGQDPIVYTAEGPGDPAVARFKEAISSSGCNISEANQTIGETLGRVLKKVLQESGVRRAVVSGGDTSGHATQQLGIFALSALSPTIPGAAIFRAHADGPMDGLELALKGGQMGSPDYFGWVRSGGGLR